jgi:hypothetical protein
MRGKSRVLVLVALSAAAGAAFVVLRSQPLPGLAQSELPSNRLEPSSDPKAVVDSPDPSRTAPSTEPPIMSSVTPTDASAAQVPAWLKNAAHQCGLSTEEVARVLADPERMREGQRVWEEFGAAVTNAYMAKGEISKKICADRQARGDYEVYHPKARLPDEDPRIGDHIFFHAEKNPQGPPDLVRVIRVLPGEHPDLDQAAQALRSLQATRRTTMREILTR